MKIKLYKYDLQCFLTETIEQDFKAPVDIRCTTIAPPEDMPIDKIPQFIKGEQKWILRNKSEKIEYVPAETPKPYKKLTHLQFIDLCKALAFPLEHILFSVLSASEYVYNGDDVLLNVDYTSGNKMTFTYNGGRVESVQYYDIDGVTLMATNTFTYTNGFLTSNNWS